MKIDYNKSTANTCNPVVALERIKPDESVEVARHFTSLLIKRDTYRVRVELMDRAVTRLIQYRLYSS